MIMASFDDTFRLETKSESFADIFDKKLHEKVRKWDEGFLSLEKISCANGWIVEVVGEPFGGSSRWEADNMAKLLMECVIDEAPSNFSANYELHDYRGGDQAFVNYDYSSESNQFQFSGEFAKDCELCNIICTKQNGRWTITENTVTEFEGDDFD